MAAFPKDDLIEVVACAPVGHEAEGYKVISDEIVGERRWTIVHRRVFAHGGSFYEARYEVGATENQDDSPFDYDTDPIECAEVFPVERTVTFYEPAPAEVTG